MTKTASCRTCRETLPSPVPFCPYCGTEQPLGQQLPVIDSAAGESVGPINVEPTELAEKEASASTQQTHPQTPHKEDITPEIVKPNKRKRLWLLVSGIAALGIMVLLAVFFIGRKPPPPPCSQFADFDVAAFHAKNPSSEDRFRMANQLYECRRVDQAFLVYRGAARQGVAEANTAIGHMYDPVKFGTILSVFKKPNARKALEWYQAAITKGDENAVQELKRLVEWLREECESGSRDACDS